MHCYLKRCFVCEHSRLVITKAYSEISGDRPYILQATYQETINRKQWGQLHFLNTQCVIAIYVVFMCNTLHKSFLLSINIGYITVDNLGYQHQTPIQGSAFSASSVANICEYKRTPSKNNLCTKYKFGHKALSGRYSREGHSDFP